MPNRLAKIPSIMTGKNNTYAVRKTQVKAAKTAVLGANNLQPLLPPANIRWTDGSHHPCRQ